MESLPHRGELPPLLKLGRFFPDLGADEEVFCQRDAACSSVSFPIASDPLRAPLPLLREVFGSESIRHLLFTDVIASRP